MCSNQQGAHAFQMQDVVFCVSAGTIGFAAVVSVHLFVNQPLSVSSLKLSLPWGVLLTRAHHYMMIT